MVFVFPFQKSVLGADRVRGPNIAHAPKGKIGIPHPAGHVEMHTAENVLSAATTPSSRSPALVPEGKAPAARGLESRAGCVGVPPGGPALACQADRERLLLEALVLKRRLLEILQVGVRESFAPAHSLHLAHVPSNSLSTAEHAHADR